MQVRFIPSLKAVFLRDVLEAVYFDPKSIPRLLNFADETQRDGQISKIGNRDLVAVRLELLCLILASRPTEEVKDFVSWARKNLFPSLLNPGLKTKIETILSDSDVQIDQSIGHLVPCRAGVYVIENSKDNRIFATARQIAALLETSARNVERKAAFMVKKQILMQKNTMVLSQTTTAFFENASEEADFSAFSNTCAIVKIENDRVVRRQMLVYDLT